MVVENTINVNKSNLFVQSSITMKYDKVIFSARSNGIPCLSSSH